MLQSMKILIIEDDLDAASYLVKAFREAGHTTEHASDGESGLFMASENAYDVLIVDRMLPKRDGLSVISELRKRSVNTPVLTAGALIVISPIIVVYLIFQRKFIEGLTAGASK